MDSRYAISAALPDHLDALPGIEVAAATLLEGHAPTAVLQETTPPSVFLKALEQSRLWVALLGQIPVGFAHVEMLGADLPHLQEMDVLPQHGRRGVGTALLRAVFDWAHRSRHKEITLTTFRAVPWNMPFYSRLGFEEIPVSELRPQLKAIVQDEADRGLDPARRVVMRYRVPSLGLESGVVRVVPYDPEWPRVFAVEARCLVAALQPIPLVLEHTGSTSVRGLAAKPILDILAGFAEGAGAPIEAYIARLVDCGYVHRGEQGIPGREFFRRGEPRAYHIHLTRIGSQFWREQLAFRDYLRTHPAIRDEYARLKNELAAKFPRDRGAYIDGKGTFVRQVLALATGPQA
jgi:GrpB-like predicted nucleotidyltransferase (UPF0157 family)/GNAT superfamily N-acetyltransferase